jgi:hypothetical protein
MRPHRLPDALPIVAQRVAREGFPSRYEERELGAPVDLCGADGLLAAEAVGWSRAPLVRANLAGPRLRRKRWNFWNWIDPDFVFSLTLADVDYASLATVTFHDLEAGESLSETRLGRPGRFALPERVEASVAFAGPGFDYANEWRGDGWRVRFRGRTRRGLAIEADFEVRRPAGHESLNVVVPWSRRRFQLNHKDNGLPCEGRLEVGGRRFALRPERCFGVPDFGRGVWPYRSFWNWAVATGPPGEAALGVNMGGRWTTGTGSNENGIWIDGRLHKVMEDLLWSYDAGDPSQPWRVRTEHSDALDLVLEPRFVHRAGFGLGLLASGGFCAFGRWRGRVRVGGRSLEADGLVGWAEEFAHRW